MLQRPVTPGESTDGSVSACALSICAEREREALQLYFVIIRHVNKVFSAQSTSEADEAILLLTHHSRFGV